MEIGADHHVAFILVTEEADIERVGPTLLTPNELVMCPAGSVELGQFTDPESHLLGLVRTVE
jgi:hypothetical protein